jgi:G3E family GTPase
MIRRLPVTLVGGFAGAGKTSLLHEFISGQPGGYVAVLVENPGPVNLDARALRGLCGAMRRQQDVVLEIPALEEEEQASWLAGTLRELAERDCFERVLIETAATTNAARLASRFTSGHGLGAWAEVRQIVGVVDALDFYRTMVAPAPGRPTMPGLADLQRAQIEGATLVVLNKCDLVSGAEREACLRRLGAMNGHAFFVETAYGELPPEAWRNPASGEQLAAAAGSVAPETSTALGELISVVYRAYRPFHPERLWEWFNGEHAGLLRVKGLVWLATRHLLVGGISRTRWQNSCGGAGIWWDALPREEWPQDAEALAKLRASWREPYGDRRQELVLLGEGGALRRAVPHLNACLLRDDELARKPEGWRGLADPFPGWDVGEGE